MITARVPLKKSGVHAWNIRFLDLREDGEIRIGVCDESVDVNAVLGSDTHGWAFSSSGGIFHNGARHPHPVPKARDGDSVTIIVDYRLGIIVFDMWDFSGASSSMVHAYEGLKDKSLYPVISFGKPGQRIKATHANA